MTDRAVSAAPRRVAWIDHARGTALIAMVVYHFCFDLELLGIVPWSVSGDPLWRTFAMSIAGSFIALSGASLQLAARGGLDRSAFLRRLAMISGAAALVTLGSWAAMPVPVFFGILHAIALFSVLALPFLHAPTWLVLLTAVVTLAVPFQVASEAFSHPLLYPLGLDPTPRPSFDYEPIFPWFAPMLLGIALARLLPTPRDDMARDLVARAGRHSLVIYLVHQPLLYGVLLGLLHLGVI